MKAYRITPEEYAADLSGNGARLYGGRWNSEGLRALYTASSRALALLETLVHISFKQLEERSYKLIEIEIPNSDPYVLNHTDFFKGWNSDFIQVETQNMGNRFLTEKENLVLGVPSVVMPEEHNFIINPLHLDFDKVKIVNARDLFFSERLMKAV